MNVSMLSLPVRFVLAAALLSTGLAAEPRMETGTAESAARMTSAAEAFLGSLTPAQRQQAVFPADDPERRNWSNLPHTLYPRKGVRMGELSAEQRVQAHHLIQSGLSSQGYLKTSGIMQLDEVLLYLSGQDKAENPLFGLKYYWISFLGEPSATRPWGWQLDGHHLALNFTVAGSGVAVTPTFMGSDPHEVRDGLHAGWRVLGAEDDQGLALMRALRPEQQKLALVRADAPPDVLAGAGKDTVRSPVEGIPFGQLDDAQKMRLMRLVDEYVRNYAADLAVAQLDRINRTGWDKVTFAWAGPVGPSAPYYYRIQGPAVLIEFDNNRPPGRPDRPINHIHSVYRDPQNDYGEDLLRRHLEESHGQKAK